MTRTILKRGQLSILSISKSANFLASASNRRVLTPVACPSVATPWCARSFASSLFPKDDFQTKSRQDEPGQHKHDALSSSCYGRDEGTEQRSQQSQKLTHVDPTTGAAHMVDVAHKEVTSRAARAACAIHFSNDTAPRLIRENNIKKGDVLGVARIAGIMAAKRTPDLIPLCHPLILSHISVELTPVFGFDHGNASGGNEDHNSRIDVTAKVCCDGKTGVEMEALTAASAAALTVYDMCKAVDKGMRIEGLRLVSKVGGKSGSWGEAREDDANTRS